MLVYVLLHVAIQVGCYLVPLKTIPDQGLAESKSTLDFIMNPSEYFTSSIPSSSLILELNSGVSDWIHVNKESDMLGNVPLTKLNGLVHDFSVRKELIFCTTGTKNLNELKVFQSFNEVYHKTNVIKAVTRTDLKYVYLLEKVGGTVNHLQIMNFDDPTNPVLVGSLRVVTSTWDVVIGDTDNDVYLVDNNYVLSIVDLKNMSSIKINGTFQVDDEAKVFAVGSYVYTLNNANLKVYDLTNKLAPKFASSIPISTENQDLFVSGSYVYIAGGKDGIRVVDMSDIFTPQLCGSFDTGINAGSIFVSGNLVFITSTTGHVSNYGTVILNAKDKSSIFILSTINSEDPNKIIIQRNDMFINDQKQGLLSIRFGSLRFFGTPSECEKSKKVGIKVYDSSGDFASQEFSIEVCDFKCHGKSVHDPNVCHGRGECKKKNDCKCRFPYYGYNCTGLAILSFVTLFFVILCVCCVFVCCCCCFVFCCCLGSTGGIDRKRDGIDKSYKDEFSIQEQDPNEENNNTNEFKKLLDDGYGEEEVEEDGVIHIDENQNLDRNNDIYKL